VSGAASVRGAVEGCDEAIIDMMALSAEWQGDCFAKNARNDDDSLAVQHVT
jgi:hypothetical protein